MDEKTKEQIDNMSYFGLLNLWRHAKSADPWFQGTTGAYFAQVMWERKEQLSQLDQVAASKAVGW